VKQKDRGTEFKQRCEGLGIHGVTLHSYRYSWAQRAKAAGYPQRYAQQALGHASKAVTEAYAADAQFVLPSLEEYEARQTTAVPVLMQAVLQEHDAKSGQAPDQKPQAKALNIPSPRFELN
jgi:Phage integrase family